MIRTHSEAKIIRSAVVFWLLTAGYMAAIFFISSYKGHRLPSLPNNLDKVVHMMIYIPLAFFLYLSLEKSGLRKYVFAIAFLSACIYGVSDELHQSFVPGRYSDAGDAYADFLGAFVGCLGASFLKRDSCSS